MKTQSTEDISKRCVAKARGGENETIIFYKVFCFRFLPTMQQHHYNGGSWPHHCVRTRSVSLLSTRGTGIRITQHLHQKRKALLRMGEAFWIERLGLQIFLGQWATVTNLSSSEGSSKEKQNVLCEEGRGRLPGRKRGWMCSMWRADGRH